MTHPNLLDELHRKIWDEQNTVDPAFSVSFHSSNKDMR